MYAAFQMDFGFRQTYNKEDYEMLKEKVTPEVVKACFGEICKGEVVAMILTASAL